MKVQELENEITKLSKKELAKFSQWFVEYQSEVWDNQIENDLEEGKLDEILKKVDKHHEKGETNEL